MPANGRWDLIRRLKINIQKFYVVPTLRLCALQRTLNKVGSIATRRVLDGAGIVSGGDGGARFSAPLQIGPVAHPASCAMGTVSLSRG